MVEIEPVVTVCCKVIVTSKILRVFISIMCITALEKQLKQICIVITQLGELYDLVVLYITATLSYTRIGCEEKNCIVELH